MTFFQVSRAFDPMRGLLDLQRELDRAFEGSTGVGAGLSGRGVFPAVNIFSHADGYVVRLEIPGVVPDQLTIETHDRTLTISGTRDLTAPSGGSFHRRERGHGDFSRSLQLPDDLDAARAEAAYQLGILTIRIPKREESKPRHISIKPA
jgi:HSP20 family protein